MQHDVLGSPASGSGLKKRKLLQRKTKKILHYLLSSPIIVQFFAVKQFLKSLPCSMWMSSAPCLMMLLVPWD